MNLGRGLGVLALVSGLAAAAPAVANDGAAVLGAGGIEFKQLTEVSMQSERLVISPEKITVAYVFRNHSAQEISTRVAFPIPEYDDDPDSDIQLDVGSSNPMRFKVIVDGKPRRFATEVKKARGKVRMIHHWTQTFPAGGSVKIEHQYRPVTGSYMTWDLPEVKDTLEKEYCLPPALWQKLARGEHRVHEVHYILETAGTWAGPIQDFQLLLRARPVKAHQQFVSTCFPGVVDQGGGRFSAAHRSFTPDRNLKVVFIDYFPESIQAD